MFQETPTKRSWSLCRHWLRLEMFTRGTNLQIRHFHHSSSQFTTVRHSSSSLPDDLLPPLTPDNTGMALPEWWKVRAPHSHIRMSVATDPSFYLPQDACGRLHARPAHAAESV